MRLASFRSCTIFWRNAKAAALLCLTSLAAASAQSGDNAATFYVGRISSVNAWHDLITAPGEAEFVDAYVAVAALSHVLGRYHHEHLSIEAEATGGIQLRRPEPLGVQRWPWDRAGGNFRGTKQ